MTMPPGIPLPQAHSKPKTGSLTASGYSAAPSAASAYTSTFRPASCRHVRRVLPAAPAVQVPGLLEDSPLSRVRSH
jgi:hypothetical protein